MSKKISDLPHIPGENPFIVARGGFYRRWLQMIDNMDEFEEVVSELKTTLEYDWVPKWRELGKKYENLGDKAELIGNYEDARHQFLLAKTFYAIGRFPSEITDLKKEISADCSRAYKKASQHLDPALEIVEIVCNGLSIKAHFRTPKKSTPVPAVLIMCGADVFKEDRGWAAELALQNGLAALVMDAPGTGENQFPWAPESVVAWEAAIDYIMERPEVDQSRVGAFGISRGGYSVLQLAGTAPKKVKAVVAIAGHPFHNEPTEEEMKEILKTRNERAKFRFGQEDGPTWVPKWSAEKEIAMSKDWSLESLGLVEKINMPVLMINGDQDGLAPASNIYFMLQSGKPGSRSSKIYKNSGHCAFDHQLEWGPITFEWLADKLQD